MDLPNEVIRMIFKKLEYKQMKAVSRTCYLWAFLALSFIYDTPKINVIKIGDKIYSINRILLINRCEDNFELYLNKCWGPIIYLKGSKEYNDIDIFFKNKKHKLFQIGQNLLNLKKVISFEYNDDTISLNIGLKNHCLALIKLDHHKEELYKLRDRMMFG